MKHHGRMAAAFTSFDEAYVDTRPLPGNIDIRAAVSTSMSFMMGQISPSNAEADISSMRWRFARGHDAFDKIIVFCRYDLMIIDAEDAMVRRSRNFVPLRSAASHFAP